MMSNSTSVGTDCFPIFMRRWLIPTVAGPRARIPFRHQMGLEHPLHGRQCCSWCFVWNSLSGVLVSFAAGRALGMLMDSWHGTQTNGLGATRSPPVPSASTWRRIDRGSGARRVATYRFRHAEDHIG